MISACRERTAGLTHVIDKGLGPRGWEDVLEVSGHLIDIVKLGWGTSYVTKSLERKLAVLKEKPVVIGGTFFEVVYRQGPARGVQALARRASASRTSRSRTGRSTSRASASSS